MLKNVLEKKSFGGALVDKLLEKSEYQEILANIQIHRLCLALTNFVHGYTLLINLAKKNISLDFFLIFI